jgi:2-polyprenyl-6-methoxyphenol hydroxylase-like FAD-dependent oxidoreductase
LVHVLISGVSVAGPVLARGLIAHGHRVTMVERAAAPRPGGQAIDVRGTALDVLARLGLLDRARAMRTTMKGVSVVNIDGKELWRSEEETLSGGRFDAGDLEILRDDLAALLLEGVRDDAELIYGDSIAAIEQTDDAAQVQLTHGGTRRFDLVIGADGINSKVRRLIFADATELRALGTGLAVFTAPNVLALHDWQIAYREGQGGFLLYTARNDQELRIAVGFPLTQDETWPTSLAEQKSMVLQRSARFGWEMPRLLKYLEAAPDFYFGPVAQVRLDHWSSGRVGLVGDAAYCPSPFSGQGTSLALVGAFVLAHEIVLQPDNPRAAFARYHERMKHYVELNQALAFIDAEADGKQQRLDDAKWAIRLD